MWQVLWAAGSRGHRKMDHALSLRGPEKDFSKKKNLSGRIKAWFKEAQVECERRPPNKKSWKIEYWLIFFFFLGLRFVNICFEILRWEKGTFSLSVWRNASFVLATHVFFFSKCSSLLFLVHPKRNGELRHGWDCPTQKYAWLIWIKVHNSFHHVKTLIRVTISSFASPEQFIGLNLNYFLENKATTTTKKNYAKMNIIFQK